MLHFGKIVDLTLAHQQLTKDQIERPSRLRHRSEAEKFASVFAEATKGDRPVMIFHTIHAARQRLDLHPQV